MLPGEVKQWLVENGFGEITHTHPVGGGCINHGVRLETYSGQRFFLKTNQTLPKDLFAREAEGLQALEAAQGPRVPKVYLFGVGFLLLEDLSPAPRGKDYFAKLGAQMAALHGCVSPQYGFEHDNYIGSTPQPNAWLSDGFSFFARHRLLFQAELAYRRGLLEKEQFHQLDCLAARLQEIIPEQPASLLHGDLWSGNIISDKNGDPAIIDPAAYYGWAEAELAMTDLFGSLPEEFYLAYQSVRSLEGGYRQRYPIYNLYHLINHLNIFGGGYLNSVKEILKHYS
jgi:fructosamine-3-kinase